MVRIFKLSWLIMAVAIGLMCFSCGNDTSNNKSRTSEQQKALSPIEKLQQAAETGNVHAQYQLSEHYLNENDYDNFLKWSKKAAEQGLDSAQWRLSQYYMSKTDDAESGAYWMVQAANQGHGEALCAQALIVVFQQGDLDWGLELIEKARKTDPKKADETTKTIATALAAATE